MGNTAALSGSPGAQEPKYRGMAGRICPVQWPETFRIGYLNKAAHNAGLLGSLSAKPGRAAVGSARWVSSSSKTAACLRHCSKGTEDHRSISCTEHGGGGGEIVCFKGAQAARPPAKQAPGCSPRQDPGGPWLQLHDHEPQRLPAGPHP